MNILSPTPAGFANAAELLRRGEVIAYPTETVYGLAVDPYSLTALHALFRLKARDPQHPVLLIVSGETQLHALAGEVSGHARACMNAFWPGPLSLLLPPVAGLPDALLGPEGKVCVRCPAHAGARALCEAFGQAVTSTSANVSGQPPASSVEELLVPGLNHAIDGGVLPPAPPSTVYDPETRTVLRAGRISAEALLAVHE